MRYLVDANIFLSVYQRDYPPRVFPQLWTHFVNLERQGALITLNRVQAEVLPFKDESATFFTSTMVTSSVLRAEDYLSDYVSVIAWSQSRADHFKRKALDDFAENDAADAWLVAAAIATGATVLTAETTDPNNKKRVKIPDACSGCGVDSCGFVQFLEDTGYRG